MEAQLKECYNRVLDLYKKGYITHEIFEMMKKEGFEEMILTQALCRLKLVIYKKRKSKGVSIGAIGGAMLLIGFIGAVLMFKSGHDYEFFMYGFTSVGTILICWAGYEVLS